MTNRGDIFIGAYICAVLGSAFVFAQPQTNQEVQVKPVPPAKVDVELPKDVKDYMKIQSQLLRQQKEYELEKVRRGRTYENLQGELTSLQQRKAILIEKKRIQMLEKAPPVFYYLPVKVIVGNYAIAQDGGVLKDGAVVGTAKVEKVDINGVYARDEKSLYRLDVKPELILSEVYQTMSMQVPSAPPPAPVLGSSFPLVSPPPPAPPPVPAPAPNPPGQMGR